MNTRSRRKSATAALESLEPRVLLTTFEVSPGESIQAAIDSAANNDTILINEGMYDEDVNIQNKSLQLVGVGDVTLSGENLSPGRIGLKAKGGKKITLENIDFTNFALPVDIEEVATVTISEVSASNNGLGVYVSSAKKLTINQLTSTDNGPSGLAITDVKTVAIADTTTSNNGFDGIQLDRVNKAKLTGVTANSNDDNGLDANDVGSLVITNSEFNDNGEGFDNNGIEVTQLKRSVKLKNVTANNNFDSGISVTQTSTAGKLAILDSVFSNNGQNGIDTDLVKTVNINRATVNDNGDDGLDVDGGSRVIVKSSEFARNGDDGIDIDGAIFKQRNVNAFDNGDMDIEL